MEYNNYYPALSAHPPPSVTNPQQQHGGPQTMQQQQQQPSGQMIHAPMPPQNIEQTMPIGASSHHQHMQQMQQQQHLTHHSQHMPSQQQQQHPNYHQIQPHPHGPSVSHSSSPHPQQQPHHNHQPTITGPPSQQQQQQQQSAISSQQQQHHIHPQSPHHHCGSPMQMQHPQQLGQMVRPSLGHSVINHSQGNLPQSGSHQNYFNPSPIPQASIHHYAQQNQNQHHPHTQQQSQNLQQHPHSHHHHQPTMMHHVPTVASHHPHVQQTYGRSSPYHPSLLQTELRIIELNRKLQSRPVTRHPVTPLPTHHDDSFWWERFASEFFDDDATLTLRIFEDKPVDYTIGRTLIPRFFRTYFDGGVTDLSINLRNPKEVFVHPHLITLNCDQAFIITNNIFRGPHVPPTNHGVVVHTEGNLILDFVSNSIDTLVIKSWKFYTKGCREYIDRSITALGLPNPLLVEPLTRQGLTKSTISYLKMCMIMEPMQDLMFQNRQTKLQPKICLTKLLYDRYRFTSEDNRIAPNKRNRKRKSTATPVTAGAATTKKSKANNNQISNNIGLNSNIVIIPQTPTAASTPSIAEESDSMNASTGNDPSNSNNIDSTIENLPPQVQQSVLVLTQANQVERDSPVEENEQQRFQINLREHIKEEIPVHGNQVSLVEQAENEPQNNELNQQQPPCEQAQRSSDQASQEDIEGDDIKQHDEEAKNNELVDNNANHSINDESTSSSQLAGQSTASSNNYKTQNNDNPNTTSSSQNDSLNHSTSETTISATFESTDESHSLHIEEKPVSQNSEELLRQTSEEPGEKENKSFVQIDETNRNSTASQSGNHYNIMNSIPEDREDTCRSASCDSIVAKLPPSSNNKNALTTNKQNRRRSSERKEILKEGLMRTYDFVVALKDLKCENPVLWRITNNSLLQQFAPKVQNGVVLYENTHSFAGWNPEISKNFMGVDVKLTQHNRSQITVERLFLNFQKLEDSTSFFDRHYMVYFQIIMSTVLDPLFWDGIESEPEHHDYFLTSRRIIEDITKRFKLKLSNKLKLSDGSLKNFEKYPNLTIKPLGKGESQLCRACNTTESTQVVSFGNRSYDLRSYQPVKVSCELSKIDEKDMHNNLCDICLELVKLYSEIHHMGWRLYNLAREKVDQQRVEGKPINSILDECLKDEDWLTSIYSERDKLWSAIEHIQ